MTPVWLLLLGLLPLAGQQDVSTGRGRKLYNDHCAICHSIDGVGGRGPALAGNRLPRASTDTDFLTVIRQGIGAMPGSRLIPDQDAADIITYVRSLSNRPHETVPGDPARGKVLFSKHGCPACHIVEGKGTAAGPELSGIGLRRSASFLSQSVTTPAAEVASEWRISTAVTADGATIRGRRINEDTFTIQIADSSGNIHSLRKQALASLSSDPKASLMPSYSLSGSDLTDLVAYLAALQTLP